MGLLSGYYHLNKKIGKTFLDLFNLIDNCQFETFKENYDLKFSKDRPPRKTFVIIHQ